MTSSLNETYWNRSRIALALSLPVAIAAGSFFLAEILSGILGGAAKILLIPGFCIPLACSAVAIFTVPISAYYLSVHAKNIDLGVRLWCWIANAIWLLVFFVAIFPHI